MKKKLINLKELKKFLQLLMKNEIYKKFILNKTYSDEIVNENFEGCLYKNLQEQYESSNFLVIDKNKRFLLKLSRIADFLICLGSSAALARLISQACREFY